MNFSDAFKRTLFEFDLKGSELSRMSGVSPQQISAFKNGRQGVSTETLQKLVGALPADAQVFFYGLMQTSIHKGGNSRKAAEESGSYPA